MTVRSSPMTPDRVWRDVSDALLAGLTHDLNGRVSALQGLLHVVSLGDPGDEVMALLLAESERLEETVALLRRYPRGATRAEAFEPREVVEVALVLHARREDRNEVPVRWLPAPAPPARAERSAVTRTLLVLLARAGVPALGGSAGGVEVIVGGSGTETFIGVRATGLPEDAAGDAYLRAARELAEEAGGHLAPAPGSCRIIMPAVTG